MTSIWVNLIKFTKNPTLVGVFTACLIFFAVYTQISAECAAEVSAIRGDRNLEIQRLDNQVEDLREEMRRHVETLTLELQTCNQRNAELLAMILSKLGDEALIFSTENDEGDSR